MASTPSYTIQQWKTIVVIGSVHFASAICISLQAPFYPQEAESKGGTATEYGLVFGIFELTAFISCPIFGKYLDKIGAKLALNGGVVIAALCSIFFGLLDLVPTHDAFISLSFVVRVVESLGASAALTSAFAITADVFPQSVATTFATLEVFYGVGYIAGPTIGGFLFTLDGYMLPFSVMGIVLLFVGLLIYFLLPGISSTQENRVEDDGKTTPGLLSMLSVPAVLVDTLCIMSASSSMGFYAATLEPDLRQFKLTPIAMSSMFVLSGGFYAASAPIIGRLCDRGVSPRYLTLGGCVFVLVGALLVGPAPFIPQLNSTLGLCIAGLIIHGVGLALLLVSSFIDALRSAVESGFRDGLATYGLVSGLWASSFSLGAFIGPSMAGLLFDLVGFRDATYFVLGTQLIVFLVVLVFILWNKTHKRKRINSEVEEEQGESSPLLLTGHKKSSSSPSLEPESWVPSFNEYGATTDPCRASMSARVLHPLEVFS